MKTVNNTNTAAAAAAKAATTKAATTKAKNSPYASKDDRELVKLFGRGEETGRKLADELFSRGWKATDVRGDKADEVRAALLDGLAPSARLRKLVALPNGKVSDNLPEVDRRERTLAKSKIAKSLANLAKALEVREKNKLAEAALLASSGAATTARGRSTPEGVTLAALVAAVKRYQKVTESKHDLTKIVNDLKAATTAFCANTDQKLPKWD